MIRINRDSPQALHEQLADQVRYLVATGQYRVGDRLPSTRRLAAELGISFHTVRKAYDRLAEAGLLESRAGSGFIVLETMPPKKSDRLEAGAATVQAALRQLIAFGLSDEEIEYVIEEQRSLVSAEAERPTALFIAEFTELAEFGADALANHLPVELEGVPLAQIDRHPDAEIAICPFPLVRRVLERLPRADVIGLHLLPSPEAAGAAARLVEHETLLLVVRYSDAIGPVTRLLRSSTGFSGQIIAAAVEEGDARLEGLARQCDVMLYLPHTVRRVRSVTGGAAVHHLLDFLISPSEIARIRALLPL